MLEVLAHFKKRERGKGCTPHFFTSLPSNPKDFLSNATLRVVGQLRMEAGNYLRYEDMKEPATTIQKRGVADINSLRIHVLELL